MLRSISLPQTQTKIMLANYALTYWILRRRHAAFQEVEPPAAEEEEEDGMKATSSE